jgi:hypothetical protein
MFKKQVRSCEKRLLAGCTPAAIRRPRSDPGPAICRVLMLVAEHGGDPMLPHIAMIESAATA